MKKIYFLLVFMATHIGAYSQSGILDTSFGNNGIITTQIAGDYNSGEASVVQPDGKIVIAGQAGDAFTFKVAVARYNPDGTLDISFGNSGTLIIPVGPARSYARSVDLQDDGKIVVGAYTYDDVEGDFAVLRLNTDGTLDNSFGNNGITIVDAGSHEIVDAMTILNDGRIILAGNDYDNFLAARFNTNGSLDTTFGVNGWVTSEFESSASQVKDITFQNDGKILLSGYAANISTGRHKIAAARFNPDGSIDTAFGNAGQVLFNIGNFDDYGVAVEVQTDEKIILGGYTTVSISPFKYDFAAIRLNPDGSFDTSYGDNGIAISRVYEDGRNYVEEMLIQPDNKVILVGFVAASSDSNIGMIRFDTEGNVDTTFGIDGKVNTDISGREDYGKAITLQPDNKIVLTGFSYTNAFIGEMVVARYDNNILGTDEYQSLEFSFYPNPATEQINIKFENTLTNHDVEIFDVSGKRLATSKIQQLGNIDISDLATGTYLLKLTSKNKAAVVRFIKQ